MSIRLTEIADEIASAVARYAHACRGRPRPGRASKLLENLYKKPSITVNEATELLGISYADANNMIEKFCQHRILFEITGQARNRVFFYSPYIELFSSL